VRIHDRSITNYLDGLSAVCPLSGEKRLTAFVGVCYRPESDIHQTRITDMPEQLSREYLESQAAKARAAIAFASPAADMSYAKAILNAAETKLAALDKTGR
jgi:hypothetical protein